MGPPNDRYLEEHLDLDLEAIVWAYSAQMKVLTARSASGTRSPEESGASWYLTL